MRKSVFFLAAVTAMVAVGCGQAEQESAVQNSPTITQEQASNTQAAEAPVATQEESQTVPTVQLVQGQDSLGLESNEESMSIEAQNSAVSQQPIVYMTEDISPEGLQRIYEALQYPAVGEHVAVKISTGETGSNYLRTDLIGDFVQSVNGTIVECNTAYGGERSNTAYHRQLAADHGYTAIAEVDIMDADGSMTLPVAGGSQISENYVGSHFADYDFYVVLSHFKGHAMAGFGGAIKNISIGIASSEGKTHIHTGGAGGSMWSADQDSFLRAMGEAGKSVSDYMGGNMLYINVMNRLSVDCDCDGNPAEPDMHDIGILASLDPVALDQACIDLVYSSEEGGSLVNRIESRNGLLTLEHAEEVGLGSRTYELQSID